MPRQGKKDVKQFVKNARVNTLVSKLITTLFIGIFGIMVFLPLASEVLGSVAPRDLATVGAISAYLAVVLFLIVFMGLQISTAFVSSKIVEVLSPFPLSRREVSSIVLLCFVRIFDVPLVAAFVVLLTAYSFIGGSLLGGLACIAGTAVTEVFSLALTISLARFFYSRVARGGSKSMWQTILRFVFMLVWILPTFAVYFVVNFATDIVESFAFLAQGATPILQVLALVYPFSYGFLASATALSSQIGYPVLIIAAVSSVAYVMGAYCCLKWLTGAIRKIGGGEALTVSREIPKDTLIKPLAPWLGIIRKDLRIASRAPSYASLFLLPVIQATVLAAAFSSISNVGLSNALGLLTGLSAITLLLPPALLSIEGLASAYTRSLPTKRRTLISAKTLLSTVTYMLSLVILFVIALYLGKDYSLALTIGTMHTFSVAAAIMLQLTILTNKFRKEGYAVGNIYASLPTYISTVVLGYIVASIPMVATLAAFFLTGHLILPIFLAAASGESIVMAAVVARE